MGQRQVHRGPAWLRGALIATLVLVALLLAARLWTPASDDPETTPTPSERPKLIWLAVLDTVRADHTSLCGYGRPTTPFLESLVADGASYTCDAEVSGSWTVPTHASFFTGQAVPDHGAHYAAYAEGSDYDGLAMHPLDGSSRTLAEALAAEGYQTAAVAANSLVSSATGLLRGFEFRSAPDELHAFYRAPAVHDEVVRLLDQQVDPGRPLFLFVNVMDAHDPWAPVPEGVDWVPPRETLRWECEEDEECTLDRFFRGTLAADRRDAWLAHVTDLYDHGIRVADSAVADVVEQLATRGWLDGGYRMVFTSDHGELLGEHGLAYHGRYLYEPITRVPLVVRQSTSPPPALPPRVPGTAIFELVRGGALPADPPVASAVAYPERSWVRKYDGAIGGATSVAVWSGDEKLLWTDGELRAYDLAADPGEADPRPVSDAHPLREALDPQVTRALAAGGQGSAMTPELIEALRAVGYVQ